MGYKRATDSLSCKQALSPHFSSSSCAQLIPFTARSRLWGPTPFPFLLQYFLLQLQNMFSCVVEEHLIYFLGSDRKQRHSVSCSPLCSQGHPKVRLQAGILSCRGGSSGISAGQGLHPLTLCCPLGSCLPTARWCCNSSHPMLIFLSEHLSDCTGHHNHLPTLLGPSQGFTCWAFWALLEGKAGLFTCSPDPHWFGGLLLREYMKHS